jgi:hypothetical protein
MFDSFGLPNDVSVIGHSAKQGAEALALPPVYFPRTIRARHKSFFTTSRTRVV